MARTSFSHLFLLHRKVGISKDTAFQLFPTALPPSSFLLSSLLLKKKSVYFYSYVELPCLWTSRNKTFRLQAVRSTCCVVHSQASKRCTGEKGLTSFTFLQKTGKTNTKNKAKAMNASLLPASVFWHRKKIKPAAIARHQPNSISQQCITKIN